MPLTDTAIRAAKAEAKPYKKSDSLGLYLIVQTSGARLWRMDYRHNGRRKTISFGAYPTVSLSDARDRRDAARKLLACLLYTSRCV